MNNPQIQYLEAQPGIQPGVQRKPARPYKYPESLQSGEMQVNPNNFLFPTVTYGGIKPEALAFLSFVALLSLAMWLWILRRNRA